MQLQPDDQMITKVGFTKGTMYLRLLGMSPVLTRGLLVTQDEACKGQVSHQKDANSFEGYLEISRYPGSRLGFRGASGTAK